VNLVYTHNYDCEPGSHLSFEETLRAADAEGVLVSLSQPHFSHYKWQAADADQNNGYARHAEFYVHVAGNHPSVVFYSMSHNATGFTEDANPEMIDGIQDIRPDWARKSIQPALRAEAIVKRLDPGRIVYHHSSGNLSAMDTLNFYLNFAPIQEVSDWFEHWATAGVKPLFTCEYGVPISWDWTMYRGWYAGKREFGSAPVPWEFCLAEWNAQFFGDQAYKISDWEKENLRWEAGKFRAGALWHRWDYPHDVGAPFDERYPVSAMYITDNLRAFRTLGLSANNSWEYGDYWKLRPGVDRGRKELRVDWDRLQRPGFSPDYVEGRMEWMNVAYAPSDWTPTVAAQALLRNNRPLLAYIGGKPTAVTSKDHVFLPGETVEKQIIVINNSRQTLRCDCRWSLALPTPTSGAKTVSIETGQQVRLPLAFPVPANTPSGIYKMSMAARFSNGETQEDSFTLQILPQPAHPPLSAEIALFDPRGETGPWLTARGVPYQSVRASSDLAPYDLLLVGKGALTLDGPAPDITRVREGLKVILFEQTAEVLEKRFGFRVAEYGLRWVFKRTPDHPVLAGIGEEHMRDWRGASTLQPPRLKYEIGPRYAPMVDWCGIPVTRVWRAGNRGDVASVLIEKPARGDFLPILDGGYSLQYSPLMEYHEGNGLVLFCQMDVTGRTEADPAAQTLVRNLLNYASAWKPAPSRTAVYVGDPAGKAHLEAAGFSLSAFQGGKLSTDQVLVVGAGGGRKLAADASAVADFLKAGGNLLAVELDESDANAFLPTPVRMKQAEHIAAFFAPFGRNSLLAGVSPADIHNRDPHTFPLVTGGADVFGDGILAKMETANVVFLQFAPYRVGVAPGSGASIVAANLRSEPGHPRYNLRRTYRRTSFTLTRLLANMGVAGSTPILARFHTPVTAAKSEKRWLDGLYLDTPEEWDDPYRFFGW
ncbi:MAG: Beta-galactosidase, partial [Chthonomonadaceae bacterium]|nr:Beta-galactosidase [Chthonomonadaceae bacterium]